MGGGGDGGLNHSQDSCSAQTLAIWLSLGVDPRQGFHWGPVHFGSDLALGSRHQQHDAGALVAGERRHGILSVLDILAVNLERTHKQSESAWHRDTRRWAKATLKPEQLFFFFHHSGK